MPLGDIAGLNTLTVLILAAVVLLGGSQFSKVLWNTSGTDRDFWDLEWETATTEAPRPVALATVRETVALHTIDISGADLERLLDEDQVGVFPAMSSRVTA